MTITHATTARQNAPAARAGTVAAWIVQLALAGQFAAGGLLKLTGNTQMVDTFTDVGAGQWLRYLVGTLELAGAVGLLVPSLVGLAALGLAGLMIGAAITNVAVLGTSPALPAALLLVAGLLS